MGERAGDHVKNVETSQLMDTMNIGIDEKLSYDRWAGVSVEGSGAAK